MTSLPPTSQLRFERLRAESADDQAFMLRLLNEQTFIRYIGDRGVRTLEQAHDYLQAQIVNDYARAGFGFHRLVLRDGDVAIGICGIIQREWLPQPDLGYALLPEYAGKGYTREAGSGVLAYARSVLKLGRILAVTQPDNSSSIRVLEALGFRCDGNIRAPNGDRELKLFASEATFAR